MGNNWHRDRSNSRPARANAWVRRSGSELNAASEMVIVFRLQLVEMAIPHLVRQPGIPGIGAESLVAQIT